MLPKFTYGKLADETEVGRLGQIIAQCFIAPASETEKYFKLIGVESFRVVRQDKQIVGGLATLPMGQWYGGVSVPMTGIAAVGVAPEARGSGAAIALMQNVVRELHERGIPISVLYPATQRLYRKAGYEQGGSYCKWEISSHDIQVREQPLPVKPIDCDRAVIEPLYQQQARANQGNLDRHAAIWQRVTTADEGKIFYAYAIGDPDPQGYIVISQQRTQDITELQIEDWAILSPEAGKSFWAFLNSHRSQIDKVRWQGTAIDSLSLLLPEQTAQHKFCQRWLLRIVSVEKALSARGYPPGIESELHLEVHDDLLQANCGKFILSVAHGRGEVTRGGRGEMKLDVRGLAPLYTNLFIPQQLQRLGYLEATETAIATATALFSNSSPWMPDFF